jgi:hypothetical protein
MTLPTTRSRRKLAAFIAATLTVAAAAACGDFTGVPASLPTLTDSGIVYALNGAPPGAPTALHMFSGTLLAADGGFIFDVAFDIDSAGDVVILPEPAVASGLVTNHTVALAAVSDAFDALGSAPKIAYRADTALVTKPNVTVVVQSTDPNACSVSLTGTTLYAKIVVTSVDLVSRQLMVHFTSDPNCGFRSFSSGIPKD